VIGLFLLLAGMAIGIVIGCAIAAHAELREQRFRELMRARYGAQAQEVRR
jgi:hypothetical protein